MNSIKINDEYIRLDQALKLSGIAGTGGHAKNIILDGDVAVNGEVCLMRGKKLRRGDKINAYGEQFMITNDG